MSMVAYIETVHKVRLYEFQKRIIRKMTDLKPEDIKVFRGKDGTSAICLPKSIYTNDIKCRILIAKNVGK